MMLSFPLYRLLPDEGATVQDSDVLPSVHQNVGIHVLIHVIAIVLLNLGLGALWGFLERVGVQIGLSTETIGAVLSASTIAMISGSMFAGWLAVRVGRAVPMLLASVFCGVSALGVMTAETLFVYAAAVMLYGVAYLFLGPYIIVGVGSALDSSGRLAPACGGIMFLSYSIGIGGGGYIVDAFSYPAIGWAAFVSCVVSGVLFFFARAIERRQTSAI